MSTDTLDLVHVRTLPNPFLFERTECEVADGVTIAELLADLGIRGPVRVWVGAVEIPPDYFGRVRPKRGAVVTVRAVARGGGQGQNIGKAIGGVVLAVVGVLMIVFGAALATLTFGTTAGWVAAGWYVTGLGVSIAISGIINLLIPPPKQPSLGNLSGIIGSQSEPESPTLSISGQQNSIRPYAPVPVVLGRHRVFPPYAAMPFTETVGPDQYLRLLFLLTYGPCVISDLKLGDTAIGNFQAVELEQIQGAPGQQPSRLYATDVFEDPLSVLLTAGTGQIRTSQLGAVELSVDVAFPEGLVVFAADGSKSPMTVVFTVEYRLVGAGSFTSAPGSPVTVTDAHQGPVRAGLRWEVAGAGQYDVRMTRTTPDNSDPLVKNVLVWSALRTYGQGDPVQMDNVSLLAMRIKATDQLNGIVSDFNCIVETVIPDYATYAGSVLADGPVGYWRLGELAGAPTAFDATGHGFAGTYQGTPTLGAPGLLVADAATAMLADGTNDHVVITSLATTDMGGMSFTVEALVKPTNLTGNRGIVHKGDGQEFATGHTGWSLIRAGNVFRFTRAVGSGAPTLVDSPPITAGQTYHVAVVYDHGSHQARMAVNGAFQAPVSMPTATYADIWGVEISQSSDSPWQGTIQEVSVTPAALSNARVVAHYDASQGDREWVVQKTSNPASMFRYVLQSGANARPLPDSRIDLPAIEAWHAENSIGGRSCNLVVDYETTVFELLKVICGCGRATLTMNDDRYAPVRDLPQSTPVQHFTPRNTRNWSGSRVLPEAVHAVKVRFINPAASWRQDERIVYDDGYSATGEVPGTVPATRFGVLDLHGCTDPDLAWRSGRYHLAVTRLRPELYTHETDIESLVCRRGDLVRVTHDVMEFGLASGRIKSVAVTGGQATQIVTDEVMPMVGGTNYGVRIRRSTDGSSLVAAVTTVPGEQTTLVFSPALAAPHPAVGDLVQFGVRGQESVECLVARIVPAPDFMARLSLVDYAPGVQGADQGPIPPYESNITTQAPIERVPPTPIIDSVVSDESVLLRDVDGSLTARILITLHFQATSDVAADYVDTRWRRSDSSSPFTVLPPLPPDTSTIVIAGVEDGVMYDLRIRTATDDGRTSPWTELVSYVVVGKTTAPPPPTNLRVDNRHPDDEQLLWDYTPPQDLAGFVIRRAPGTNTTWDSATTMHVGIWPASPFLLPRIYGVWTLLVSAIDTSGNRSVPATLTVDFGDPRIHNLVESFDYKAASFPGTVTNGSLAAGNLAADQVTTGFWTVDGNLFWSPSGATLFWAGTYKEMTYVFTFTPAAGSAGARLVFQLAVQATGWTLEWKKGALAYAPFPGTLENIEAVAHTFRLRTDASIQQGIVSQLTAIVDADTISERFPSFATAATTGTRLTLALAYRQIKTVIATTVASGAETAITAVAADKQNTAGANNGPLIRSYDAAGAVVAGHCDVEVTGF